MHEIYQYIGQHPEVVLYVFCPTSLVVFLTGISTLFAPTPKDNPPKTSASNTHTNIYPFPDTRSMFPSDIDTKNREN